jgi:hypothetical protein
MNLHEILGSRSGGQNLATRFMDAIQGCAIADEARREPELAPMLPDAGCAR